ncbi:hypothetical protein EDB86DRAFT_2962392 [Lactarius hatsudake]|nr:hypothetical protein EDB86DRAFT_2962392 [Lactarius hatsudake]
MRPLCSESVAGILFYFCFIVACVEASPPVQGRDTGHVPAQKRVRRSLNFSSGRTAEFPISLRLGIRNIAHALDFRIGLEFGSSGSREGQPEFR